MAITMRVRRTTRRGNSAIVRRPVAIQEHEFGELGDGRRIARFALDSASGLRAEILSYGGALRSLAVPDRAGRLDDVVLGFDDLAGYVAGQGYLGALIGRCANRIGGAR